MEYLDLVPVVENPNVVKAMQKKLTDLGKPFVVFILIHLLSIILYICEGCCKCDTEDETHLFKGSLEKHVKECENGCTIDGT